MQEFYSIKDYLTNPIVSKLSDSENKIRYEIMDFIIKNHKPYSLKESPYEKELRLLAEKNILSIDENDEVIAIYPVSALKTNKKIFFQDGNYAYAMCAIDAIGFHYTFNEPVLIYSECEHCGDKIVLSVRDGKINVVYGNEDIVVLHADLENSTDWSCSCCNIMHFFNCHDNLLKWQNEHCIHNKVFAVNLETANKIAWLLFAK